jgi:hypothetical protein
VSLDWPTFGDALWKVSDQLGIRPEWQLPVLSMESGGTFDPSIMNSGGCSGINQLCPGTYEHYVNVPVSEYRTWPASKQLAGPVFDYWRDALRYGPIRSSTRLMLSQLGQGLLKTAPSLDSIVFSSPSIEYKSNSGLDVGHDGYITVDDLANAMKGRARTAAVRDALARVYAMRPGERPRDAVYGDDYALDYASVRRPIATPASGQVIVVVVALAAAAGYVASERRRFA